MSLMRSNVSGVMVHSLGSLTSLIRLRASCGVEFLVSSKFLSLVRSSAFPESGVNFHSFILWSKLIKWEGAEKRRILGLIDCDELGGTCRLKVFAE